MPDVIPDIGTWALSTVGLPLLVWTVAALAMEAVLRLWPSLHPVVLLNARRAMLWSLPTSLLAALALPAMLSPEAIERVAALTPVPLALPEITVGGTPGAPSDAPPVPLAPRLAGLALLAAALVAAVRIGALARGLWRLRGLSAGTQQDSLVQHETDRIARDAGLERRIHAVTTTRLTVPFTYGWRRPVVVIPEDLAEDPASLRLVLAHEITHIARGDFASGVAEQILAAVFGWHPLATLIARQIDVDRERATDAVVLSTRPHERRAYAQLLLSFSRLPSPALALGAARGSHSLTSRITTMQAPPLPPRRLRRLGRVSHLLAVALFVGAVALTSVMAVGPAQARAFIAPEAQTAVASDDTTVPSSATISDASMTLSDAVNADAPDVAERPDANEPLAPEALVIRGIVTDASNGRPLVGANVLVVGTQKGAATDERGAFVINGVEPGDAQLRIVFVGYQSLTVVPQAGEPLRVGLSPLPVVVGTITEQAYDERVVEGEPAGRVIRELDSASRNNGAPRPEVFMVVEDPPRLIGGTAALAERVVYPPEAKADGIEGRVFVQFIVDEQGNVRDAACKGGSTDPRLCSAAIAAVNGSTFTPGRQRGETVKVRFTLPVVFSLTEE